MKKTILLFVFDGFAEWETSYTMTGIMKSNAYQIKTIALEKETVQTLGGLCVLPDLDFRPDVDLADIDNTNTAMIILSGGSAWEEDRNTEIQLLIRHCVNNHIPVAATGNSVDYLKAMNPYYQGENFYQLSTIITARGTDPIEFAKAIFEVLTIENDKNTNVLSQSFNTLVM